MRAKTHKKLQSTKKELHYKNPWKQLMGTKKENPNQTSFRFLAKTFYSSIHENMSLKENIVFQSNDL